MSAPNCSGLPDTVGRLNATFNMKSVGPPASALNASQLLVGQALIVKVPRFERSVVPGPTGTSRLKMAPEKLRYVAMVVGRLLFVSPVNWTARAVPPKPSAPTRRLAGSQKSPYFDLHVLLSVHRNLPTIISRACAETKPAPFAWFCTPANMFVYVQALSLSNYWTILVLLELLGIFHRTRGLRVNKNFPTTIFFRTY